MRSCSDFRNRRKQAGKLCSNRFSAAANLALRTLHLTLLSSRIFCAKIFIIRRQGPLWS